jgi:hypothetical protein
VRVAGGAACHSDAFAAGRDLLARRDGRATTRYSADAADLQLARLMCYRSNLREIQLAAAKQQLRTLGVEICLVSTSGRPKTSLPEPSARRARGGLLSFRSRRRRRAHLVRPSHHSRQKVQRLARGCAQSGGACIAWLALGVMYLCRCSGRIN